jgi:hypothetical protein
MTRGKETPAAAAWWRNRGVEESKMNCRRNRKWMPSDIPTRGPEFGDHEPALSTNVNISLDGLAMSQLDDPWIRAMVRWSWSGARVPS